MSSSSTAIKAAATMSSRYGSRARRYGWVPSVLLGVALCAAILASLCIGAYPMSFWKASRILGHLAWPGPLPANPPWTAKEITVVQLIRLPRVLVATLAGMGLGMAGTALQGMIRNPLVGPDIVGVSSGAGFGAVLAMLLQLPPLGIIALAFCGAMVAILCTFSLSKAAGASANSTVLVLAGIFIGAFFTAMVSLVQFIAPDWNTLRMTYWLLGTFAEADATKVTIIAVPTLACGSLLMLLRWRLNLLSLGTLDATSLGVNAGALRWVLIALVSLIVAAQVAVSGIVGWVGLVVPHCARMLVGPDHRRLLPTAALLGSLFVLGLDDIARSVVKADLPVGILSALIGTPVVCALLWKSRGKGWGDE